MIHFQVVVWSDFLKNLSGVDLLFSPSYSLPSWCLHPSLPWVCGSPCLPWVWICSSSHMLLNTHTKKLWIHQVFYKGVHSSMHSGVQRHTWVQVTSITWDVVFSRISCINATVCFPVMFYICICCLSLWFFSSFFLALFLQVQKQIPKMFFLCSSVLFLSFYCLLYPSPLFLPFFCSPCLFTKQILINS